jgi:hypothetical protein
MMLQAKPIPYNTRRSIGGADWAGRIELSEPIGLAPAWLETA